MHGRTCKCMRSPESGFDRSGPSRHLRATSGYGLAIALWIGACLLAGKWAQAQDLRSWQIGGFAEGGFVPSYNIHNPRFRYNLQLDFVNAGIAMGKTITRTHGSGVFRGRGEAVLEVIPFWLANYPSQTLNFSYPPNSVGPSRTNFSSLQRFGASVTPVLFRWNFTKRATDRLEPWAQLGGGVLWTNHKFPVIPYTTANTSVINFTPQVGVGESAFIRKNRSLDFAIKAVHISNASLGDNNPGLNVTLQFSAGYSWWK